MSSGPSQSDTNVPFTADQSSDRPANSPGSVSTADPSRPVTIMKGPPLAATRPVGTTLARTVSVRSEERRVGKSVDLGGRRIIKKKKKRTSDWTYGGAKWKECEIGELVV